MPQNVYVLTAEEKDEDMGTGSKVPKERENAVNHKAKEPKVHGSSADLRMKAIGDELKKMSLDELREKGDRYKELIEARDLEDCLFK